MRGLVIIYDLYSSKLILFPLGMENKIKYVRIEYIVNCCEKNISNSNAGLWPYFGTQILRFGLFCQTRGAGLQKAVSIDQLSNQPFVPASNHATSPASQPPSGLLGSQLGLLSCFRPQG